MAAGTHQGGGWQQDWVAGCWQDLVGGYWQVQGVQQGGRWGLTRAKQGCCEFHVLIKGHMRLTAASTCCLGYQTAGSWPRDAAALHCCAYGLRLPHSQTRAHDE